MKKKITIPIIIMIAAALTACSSSANPSQTSGQAAASIADTKPEAQHGEIRKYNLSNQGGANLGMICGGEVEVLYELL